jgi:hypothetical protein
MSRGAVEGTAVIRVGGSNDADRTSSSSDVQPQQVSDYVMG